MDVVVKSADLAGSGIQHAHTVKAGPWIFLNGHEAYDFAQGLNVDVEGPLGFPSFGLPRFRREADFVVRRAKTLLREQGSDLSRAVRIDQFYPTPEAVTSYHQTRRNEFGSYIPPSTSIIVQRCVGAHANLSMSLIAVRDELGLSVNPHYPRGVEVPQGSSFAPAVTCGDFVFIAGHMAGARELAPAAVVPANVRWGASAIRRQAEEIIKGRLEPALEGAGTSLSASVKAQAFVQGAANIPDFLDVWNQYFDSIPCALTVVPITSLALVSGIVEINLIAMTAEKKLRKQVIATSLPSMSAYGPCLRAGDFIFPSGLIALTEDGHVVGRADATAFDALGHAAYVQSSRVLTMLNQICASAGVTLKNVVRAQYYLSNMPDLSAVHRAWQKQADNIPHPFIAVEIPEPPLAHGAVMCGDFWIFAPVG